MENRSAIVQYQSQVDGVNRFLFFAPFSINLLGFHTEYTGGKTLSAGIQKGIWLYVEPDKTNTLSFEYENLKITLTHDRLMEKTTDSRLAFPLEIIKRFLVKGMPFHGFRLKFFSDFPNPDMHQTTAAVGTALAVGLNEIFHLELDKSRLYELLHEAAGNLKHFFSFANLYGVVFAKPGNIIHLDCHEFVHTYLPFEQEKYSWVLIHTDPSPANDFSLIDRRKRELQTAKEQINQYFEVPHLGALEGADYDWLDKLLEDKTAKKRLRHVVNENTRVDWAVELLQRKSMVEFGQLMFDAHESAVMDFELLDPEVDRLVRLAKETEGVLGACMMDYNFPGCSLNLVEKKTAKVFTEQVLSSFYKETGQQAIAYPVQLSGIPAQYNKTGE